MDLDDALVATGGTVTPSICLIPQGTTEVQRDGRKCTITNIAWRYEFRLAETDAAATPAAPDVMRIIMFLDKQCNGATAAVTDILESADYQSFNNLVNSGRFIKILDRTVSINYASLASDNAAVVSQAAVTRSGVFYKTCNFPLEFNGVTGAITEIRSNNLGVLLISKTGVVEFNSKIRLRFRG